MKIDKLSFVDRASIHLRCEILHGRLEPGQRLTETSLSELLGTGRGTVRSALSNLETEELVIKQPYFGWSVREVTVNEIWETYTLRGALEGLAARLVAENMNSVIDEKLNAAFDRLRLAEASSDYSERVDADLNFHRTIVELADHASLSRQYFGLSNKVEWLYRWSEIHWPHRIELKSWHWPIVEAILSRNPETAETAIRDHIAASLADDLHDFKALKKQTA